jgi:23S rRNA pseudouridine1911/1915/1917 synthase
MPALSATAFSFEVTPIEAGSRLDVVVVARIEGMSRARARRLAAEGKIKVNGRPARKGRTLALGDNVSLTEVPPSPTFDAAPDPDLPLHVLYEDDAFVVVDKPPGVASHPLRPDERGTIANALAARYPEMLGVGYAAREPGILHRLDIGTSGALLAARDSATFDTLREALRRGHFDKRYLLLCRGEVVAPAVIEAPIDADPGDRRRVRVHPKGDAPLSARHARTEIASARTRRDMSVVIARARTGGRHQVRAHMAFVGHPLAGDTLYDGPVVPGLTHHFLHALSLTFDHPTSGERITVRAPLPADRRSILEELGLEAQEDE